LVPQLRPVCERIFFRRTPLDHLLQAEPDVEVPEHGPYSGAISTRIGQSVKAETRSPPDAQFIVEISTVGPSQSRARCEVVLRGDTLRRRSIDLEPAHGWTRIVIDVPAEAGGSLHVEMRADAIPGERSPEFVCWGGAALRWRRPWGEIRRSLTEAVTPRGFRRSLDRLLAGSGDPSSPTLDRWLQHHLPDQDALEILRTSLSREDEGTSFSILMVPGALDPDARERSLRSIRTQVYPRCTTIICDRIVEGDGETSGAGIEDESAARNAALAASQDTFIVTVRTGDELTPDALAEVARAAMNSPNADVFYSDEAVTDGARVLALRLKPGWSPDYLMARMYVGRLLAIRRTTLLAAGGYRSGYGEAIDFDALLRLSLGRAGGGAPLRVEHVPRVLYKGTPAPVADGERRVLEDYCRAAGVAADVCPGALAGTWRVKRKVRHPPAVTIVIPTAGSPGDTPSGRQPLIVNCLRTVLERTDYGPIEIVVADDGPLPSETESWLASLPHRRITCRANGPFNFSRKINFAVAATSTPIVVLLNDDVEPIDRHWLSAMLEYAQDEAIGAVGAQLLYPDGRLQHVGLVTGVAGVAAHLLHQAPGGSLACDGSAKVVRNCAAVTGACLMARRAAYDSVGGFNERLLVDFNDVDFCLKLRQRGLRIVYTPYARLYHHESASFGLRRQRREDILEMQRIWGDALMHDPYYNPNLSRAYPNCRPEFR